MIRIRGNALRIGDCIEIAVSPHQDTITGFTSFSNGGSHAARVALFSLGSSDFVPDDQIFMLISRDGREIWN